MDYVKEAFEKVKEDILFLNEELSNLREGLTEIKQKIEEINQKIPGNTLSLTSTDTPINSTTSTHPSTHPLSFKPLNPQNMPISTGNQGVSTDRQTDRQTDNRQVFGQNSIENASEILDSLDNIKKEIRLKFKRLTEQEWLIFSTIYQLEEEFEIVDYKVLSQRLGLTESSIRDYVGRLIKKGIPVDKQKINNKNIKLSISSKLKRITSLNTILQLRGL